MKSVCMLIILSLSACGHKPEYNVDPAAQSFVNQFYAESVKQNVQIQNNDLVVKFAALSGTSSDGLKDVGYCEPGVDSTPTVTIDPAFWNDPNTPDYERLTVVYHELGHCLLNRAHDNNWIDTPKEADIDWATVPQSIMVYDAAGPVLLGVNDLKEYYLNELFHPAQGEPGLTLVLNESY